MSRAAVVFAVALVPTIAGCGSRQTVARVAADEQTDLSGNWNDTDARLTSEAIIPALLGGGWLAAFSDANGRKPTVRVRRIVNKTDEHIDAQLFIKSIEKALVNSGKVTMLAQEGAELGSVHGEQAYGLGGTVAVETAAAVGQETGADFVVTVRLSSLLDQKGGQKVKLYKIDLELTDPSTGEKAWMGDHEIKKLVQRESVSF